MPRRTVDILASGPPSSDPYDPAAPAWALGAGLAGRGHDVQVIYPGTGAAADAPPALTATAYSPLTPHVGTWRGDVELARAAARHVRPNAGAVVRDPAGVGPVGHAGRVAARLGFVRALAVDALVAPASPAADGVRGRLVGWGERRALRRLERAALHEASTVCCSTAVLRDRVQKEYGVPAQRLRLTSAAVPPSPPSPGREPARRAIGVPDDVGVVTVLPSPDGVGAPASVLEAFQRTRVIFTGARLVLVGAPAAPPGGTVALPGRDGATIANALAAADLAVATGRPAGFDPGVVLALRAGLPTVVPAAEADPAEPALRGVDPGDAGELASVLAELLADPAERRSLGDSGRKYAERYDPARLAAELEAAGLLGRP